MKKQYFLNANIVDPDNSIEELGGLIISEDGNLWDFNEGCLSIPEVREDVLRKEEILITFFNENFELYHFAGAAFIVSGIYLSNKKTND